VLVGMLEEKLDGHLVLVLAHVLVRKWVERLEVGLVAKLEEGLVLRLEMVLVLE
jgi:hypothetical protein